MKVISAQEPDKKERKSLKDRFVKSGLDGFQSFETLSLLLSYAIPRGDVSALSKSLIKRFGGIRGVFDAAPEELRDCGLGENAMVLVKLMKECAVAYLKERMMGRDAIKNMKDVLDYLSLNLSGERVEKFLAIFMNSRNEVLAVDTLHEGTINQTAVYPRKAIEKAFKYGASAIIFVHNHPSGDPSPSNMDRQLTRVLDTAALAVDIIVHDHIIIGRSKHFSARDNGWIIGYPFQHRAMSPA